METRVSSLKREVVIGDNQPTVLIGERINPAGKKKLAEALRAGDLEIVRMEALAQVKDGTDILDVNVGTFGVDEATLLPRAVQAVMPSESEFPYVIRVVSALFPFKPALRALDAAISGGELATPILHLLALTAGFSALARLAMRRFG